MTERPKRVVILPATDRMRQYSQELAARQQAAATRTQRKEQAMTYEDFLAATTNIDYDQVTDTDDRTDEEVYAEVGALFEVAMNAFWNGAPAADVDAAARAFATAMARPGGARLYINADDIRTGDYVQATGLGKDGQRVAAVGIVEEIAEEKFQARLYGTNDEDEYPGHTLDIRPVVANGRPEAEQITVWVVDRGLPTVLRLPRPNHRRIS